MCVILPYLHVPRLFHKMRPLNSRKMLLYRDEEDESKGRLLNGSYLSYLVEIDLSE
jgi:hypothetical protein